METSIEKINIYLDESSIDNQNHKYMIIGGLFVARNKVIDIKKKILEIRKKHNFYNEIKWVKVDKQKELFLKELIDYLLQLSEDILSFHCIVVNKERIDYSKYHKSDKELAFYKFMYILLTKKIKDNSLYYIFPDFKPNKIKERVDNLHSFLDKYVYFYRINSSIKHIQSYDSKENIFIQISDLFSGAVGYQHNNQSTDTVKYNLCQHIANRIGKENLEIRSFPSEQKFNIFNIDLN